MKKMFKRFLIILLALVLGLILAHYYLNFMFSFDLIELKIHFLSSASNSESFWIVPYAFITFPVILLLFTSKSKRNRVVGGFLFFLTLSITVLQFYFEDIEKKGEIANQIEEEQFREEQKKIIKVYEDSIIQLIQKSIVISRDKIFIQGTPPEYRTDSCEKALIMVIEDGLNVWFQYDGNDHVVTRLFSEKEIIDKIKIYFPPGSKLISVQSNGILDIMEVLYQFNGNIYTAKVILNSYNENAYHNTPDPNCGKFTIGEIIIFEPEFKEIKIQEN